MKTIFTLCGVALLTLPMLGSAKTLTVQKDQATIYSEPSFLGKPIGSVRYKMIVDILKVQGSWRSIKVSQQQGWMHITALTKANLALSVGKTMMNSVISAKDIALSGKGFEKTEKDFKQKHPNTDVGFAWVNNIEKMTTSLPELEKFAVGSDFSTTAR